MRLINIIWLSGRVFITHKLRTLLTISGISVGMGTIFVLVSLGYGLQNLVYNRITNKESLLTLEITVPEESQKIIKLDKQSLTKIKEIPNVEKLSPLILLSSQMNIGELNSEVSLNVVDSSYFDLEGIKIQTGRKFNSEENNTIVISSAILKMFNFKNFKDLSEIKVGLSIFKTEEEKMIDLPGKFEIIGLINDESSNYIYAPLSCIENLKIDNFTSIKIKAKNNESLKTARSEIEKMGFNVSAISDTLEEMDIIFKTIQIILGIFGLVALIVACIGMFNTMTISLLERFRDVGIMKAIGASDRVIQKFFLIESLIISACGGIGGIIIGFLTEKLLNSAFNFLANLLGGEAIDLFYTPSWFIFIILIFSLLVGFITGFYPSKRAAKINPLDALRYE
ncbi:ABC transporter permease [Patescibacteria group bacterium]|nr:ABC transporter permease [Patescibacteria group bacterium]MBU1663411.1 ABC transporter permease [Patescibacteria group bacterium]MBU1933983.1 ABC transporter permease [Patescibacteria group bacterium]